MLDLKYVVNHLDEVRARPRPPRRRPRPRAGRQASPRSARELIHRSRGLCGRARTSPMTPCASWPRIPRKLAAARTELRQASERINKAIDFQLREVEEKIEDQLAAHSSNPAARVGARRSDRRAERRGPQLGRQAALRLPRPRSTPTSARRSASSRLRAGRQDRGRALRRLFGAGCPASKRALACSFMLDRPQRQRGYREVLPPFMVNRLPSYVQATGQFPKFEQDVFAVKDQRPLPGLDRRGACHQPLPRRGPRGRGVADGRPLRSTRPASAPRPAATARTPAGSFASTSSRRIRVPREVHAARDFLRGAREAGARTPRRILQRLGLHYRGRVALRRRHGGQRRQMLRHRGGGCRGRTRTARSSAAVARTSRTTRRGEPRFALQGTRAASPASSHTLNGLGPRGGPHARRHPRAGPESRRHRRPARKRSGSTSEV